MKQALNITNFSGGLNTATNSRDLLDVEFSTLTNLNNEVPGKLVNYGKHVDDSKCDAAISIDNIIYGNGIYHFNLDRTLNSPGTVSNTEYIAINDPTNKTVKFLNYTGTSSGSNSISSKSLNYGGSSTTQNVCIYVQDGDIRAIPHPGSTGTPKILHYEKGVRKFGDTGSTNLDISTNVFYESDMFIAGLRGRVGTADITNNLDPERLYQKGQVFKPNYKSEVFMEANLTASNILASNDGTNPNSYNRSRENMHTVLTANTDYGSGLGAESGSMHVICYWAKKSTDTNQDETSEAVVYPTSQNKIYGLWASCMYGEQESPAVFLGDIAQQDISGNNERKRFLYFGLYGRTPSTTKRITGYKFYWGLIENYDTSNASTTQYAAGSVSNKYLLSEVDFIRGIRFAGEDTYDSFDEELSSTSGGNWYNYVYPPNAFATNNTHFVGKELSKLSLSEPYLIGDRSLIGPANTGFKTVAIANRRAYIGNVKYYDSKGNLVEKNDRVLKSKVNQFDYFEEDSFIDVSVEDGDDIIKLEAVGSKLLQFKKHRLYIINISRRLEILEGEYEYKGCEFDHHVIRAEGFITWFNKHGLFIYDGQRVHDLIIGKMGQPLIKDFESEIYNDNAVIGYMPKTKEIIILCKDNVVLKYDLKSESFTKSTTQMQTVDVTNLINKNDGTLAYFYEIAGSPNTIKMQNWTNTPQSITYGSKTELLRTKEFDFTNPASRKNLYHIYINYKAGDNVFVGGYSTKFDSSPVEGSLTDSADTGANLGWTGTELTNTANEFKTQKIKVSSSNFKNILTTGLIFYGNGAVSNNFVLNDVQIVFRGKVLK